jgi:hypothetical protein
MQHTTQRMQLLRLFALMMTACNARLACIALMHHAQQLSHAFAFA